MARIDWLRRFLRYFRFFHGYTGHRIWVLVAMVFAMSYAEALGISLFYPLLSGGGISSMPSPMQRAFAILHVPPTLTGVLVALVMVFVAKGILQFASGAYQYRVSSETTRKIRQRLLSGLGAIDYAHLTSLNTGSLTNLLTTEVSRTTTAFVYFARLFPHVISIAVFFAIIVYADASFALVVGGTGFVVFYLMRMLSAASGSYSGRTTEDNNTLSSLLVQTLQAAKYLLATARYGRLERQMSSTAHRLADGEYRIGAMYSLAGALSQPLVVLFLSAVLYYQAVVLNASLVPVFVLLLYLYRIMTEVFALQLEWQNFCVFIGGLDIVSDTIDEIERHAEPSGQGAYTGLHASLELRNASFAHGDRPILRDVSLTIARHTTVGFVGESGAGKSTLMDLVNGMLRPQAGAVLLDGQDLRGLETSSYRTRLGYVPQEAVLFDDTVANNIGLWEADLADPTYLERVEDAARRAHCDPFIQEMPQGYRSMVGDRGVKLSGGQRQRLAIARELFKQPEVLLLDEATSALDSESEEAIRRSIESLRGQMTILIVAHRLSTIKNCDRIYVVEAGRIVEQGSFAELFAVEGSRFRRMCDAQSLLLP